MRRTAANIGQRTSYPKALRVAAVKAHAKTNTAKVAESFNVSPSTVCRWASAASKAKAQPKQLAAHQAAAAAIKAFNTPQVSTDPKTGATVILYQGKAYV